MGDTWELPKLDFGTPNHIQAELQIVCSACYMIVICESHLVCSIQLILVLVASNVFVKEDGTLGSIVLTDHQSIINVLDVYCEMKNRN